MSLLSAGHRRGAVSVHAMSAWDSQPATPGLWAPGCQDAGQEAREELQASGWTNRHSSPGAEARIPAREPKGPFKGFKG